MHPDRVRDELKREPFRPFSLRMADGREYRVRHPEFVYMHPDGRTIYFVDEETGRGHYLSRSLVAEVVTDPAPDPGPVPEPGVPAESGG